MSTLAESSLDGFSEFVFQANGFSHRVFRMGDPQHAPLLVMPEIAGLSPGLVRFSKRLVAAGFQLYVPWLFGPFLEPAPMRNYARLCISREFAYLRAGTTAPVASWLRQLCGHMSRENDDRNVGAIGMCLTGAFAIPLIIDPRVKAAVAAQPAIPCSVLFATL